MEFSRVAGAVPLPRTVLARVIADDRHPDVARAYSPDHQWRNRGLQVAGVDPAAQGPRRDGARRHDRGGPAIHFPLSAATLSGQPIRDDLFSLTDEAAIGHIELSRAADLVVVAPASANILARMAAGLADDLATTLLLATDKRVLAAPAMNVRMWLHPATRRNLDRLKDDGVLFVGPESGPMACGEFGPGRMAEPPAIVEAIEQALTAETALGESPESPRSDFGSAQRAAYHRHLRADI